MTIKGSCLFIATSLVALLQVGCGAASPQSMEESGDSESAGAEATSAPSAEAEGGMVDATTIDSSVHEDWRALLAEDDSLSQALELGEIDCTSAREFVSSICALAERVCDIAEDTGDGETEERCVDGRSRCERAQDRTGNRCP